MSASNLIDDIRTRIKMEDYGVENTQTSDFPGTYTGYDDSWDFDKFKKNFKIVVQKCSVDKLELEFDMIGIDAAIANSFRRILLSEIPTMAIEKVYFYNNTSVIQDEVLAHRLGLIPLKANSKHFSYKTDPEANGTAEDILEFELKVKCKLVKGAAKEDKSAYVDSKVLSSFIKWLPIGDQARKFKEEEIGPVHSDILIAKMNPGQELDLKLLAVKGIGKDHAKFSPVATAFYRLLPEIILKRDFFDAEAEKLQSCFTPGVIALIKTSDGRKKAVVANARLDMCSRQVLMYDEFKDSVVINKVRDHFIFTIESTGAAPAEDLMREAIKVLAAKAHTLLQEIDVKK